MTLRFTPAQFALSYIALGIAALALLAVPLWWGFNANLGTFRSYIPAEEMQKFVDVFRREGPQAVATAVDAYAKTSPRDQVVLFVDPQKRRLAGNLPRWPTGVPDAPGTYGLVIETAGNATTRVIVSHVSLPDGYVLLMGRDSVIFDSLVARFWIGVAGAIAIVLSLGMFFGWLLRRAHGQLEKLVAHRTAALRLSEERYARALQASNDGIWEWNSVTDEVFMSERARELWGVPAGAAVRTRAELKKVGGFHPNDFQRTEDAVAATRVPGGPGFDMEYRITMPGGEVRWVRSQGKAFSRVDGGPAILTGSLTDITERKRAEESLQLSEERYARAMEGSDAGHWEWNIVSDAMFVSERAREMLVLPPGALPLRRSEIMDLVPMHPDDRADLTDLVNAALRSGTLAHDYRVIPAPGQVRWVRVRAKIYHDARGAAVRMTGSLTDITDRKLAVDALRASEERYSLAMEASKEGHFDSRYDTGENFYSDRLLELAGFAPDTHFANRAEALKRLRFYSTSDAELYITALRSVEARNGPNDYEFDFRIALPSGEMRWLRTRGKIVRDAEGNIQRRTGVAADITEANLSADALRASEERYSLAMEAAEEAHFDAHVETDMLFTSERLNEIYGFPPGTRSIKRSEYLRSFHFYGNDAELYREKIRAVEAKDGPERYEFDFRIQGPSGEPRWLRTRARVTRDAEGRALRRTGVAADITASKQAEEALRLSEERYALAMEASEEGHFDWDVQTDKIFASERLMKLLGVPLDVEYRTRSDIVSRMTFCPGESERIAHMAREALAGSALQHEFDYQILHHESDTPRWIHVRWKIFRDAHGKAQRVISVLSDITERKHAEAELKAMEGKLRQAQRLEAMGTLAGGIAHDFNNILGAILGYGEMAMRHTAKGSTLHRDLDGIVAAGERGRALVDRVLAFSRSGVSDRVAVHVEKVVREALDQLSAGLPAAVTLHADLQAGRAAMLGDATQVHQVVMNLATNAVQAMPDGGTLHVSLQAVHIDANRVPTIGVLGEGDYIVLGVADTGTGITLDILDRIFDPFFTTKEVGTGTGLGLSLVHGIVSDVGGAIDVTSMADRGSTFTVYFPRSGDATGVRKNRALSMPRGDGQRVLVVDDEQPLVELATRTLKDLGYEATGFTSSAAALAAFRADPQAFDAVITDERMPGMSGSTLIREVRGIRGTIPIVLMSGYVGGAVIPQAREAGAEEVLKKPLSARDLASSLARVLQS